MRIAITHPFCWPYVRRGAERFISELGCFLAGRGHIVTTISSKPGRSDIEETPNGMRILHGQWWTAWTPWARLQPAYRFLLPCYASVRRLRPDIVQSLYYVDAWAAQRGKRRHKAVYYVAGPPVPSLQRRVPPDRRLLRKAIEDADALLVPSEYVRGVVREHYNRNSRLLPVPIRTADFQAPKRPGSRPVILAVAAFDERRKGLRVIVRAFARLHQKYTEALLRISGQVSERLRRDVLKTVPPELSGSIEFLGLGCIQDMPRLYSDATVTVVPATWEAYSLVVLESWAAGTPVVAACHAALPEIVTDTATGVLVDPGTDPMEPTNDEGLAWGMEQALKLAECKQTEQLCRLRAANYSWDRLGASFEQFYLDLLGGTTNHEQW